MKKLLYIGIFILVPFCSASEEVRKTGRPKLTLLKVQHERISSVHSVHVLFGETRYISNPQTPGGSNLDELVPQKAEKGMSLLTLEKECAGMPPLAKLPFEYSVDDFETLSGSKTSSNASSNESIYKDKKRLRRFFERIFWLKDK